MYCFETVNFRFFRLFRLHRNFRHTLPLVASSILVVLFSSCNIAPNDAANKESENKNGSVQSQETCEPGSIIERATCNNEKPNSLVTEKIKKCNKKGASEVEGCRIESCKPDFIISNNECVAKCQPNQPYPADNCSSEISNSVLASQEKTCNASGNGFTYNECKLAQCQADYIKVGNECAPKKCNGNETLNDDSCLSDIPNSTVALKSKKCDDIGVKFLYGDCLLKACAPGYYISNNSCVPWACTPNSDQGKVDCKSEVPFSTLAEKTKTCNSVGDGYTYGGCQASTCESGYQLIGNSCVPPICTVNQDYGTVSCVGEIAGSQVAEKTKTCNADGYGYNYGSCNLISCTSKYNKSNNSCIPKPLGEFSITHFSVSQYPGFPPSYVKYGSVGGSWSQSDNANGYTVNVPGLLSSTDYDGPIGGFGTACCIGQTVSGGTLYVYAKGEGGQVKAASNNGYSSGGELTNFSIASKTSIILNDGVDDTFSWSSSGSSARYTFAIGTTSTCSSTYYETTTTSTSVTLPLINLPLSTVYICVEAQSGSTTKNATNNGMAVIVSSP